MTMRMSPTMRSLAQEAGVTSMTVSLALRNSPKISAPTRKRLQRLAKLRGYRPDPHVSRLMHHLRSRRTERLQAMICALTTYPQPKQSSSLVRIAAGARERAADLGFGFDLLNLTDYSGTPGQLQRVLRSRGVEGIVLLPMYDIIACDTLIDWNDFSVVSTTHSVVSPEFCRVVPDQFNNVMLLCRELTYRGFRRIGLEIAEETERRVRHNFTAALTWHNAYGGTEAVRPLFASTLEDEIIVDWLRREKPDVVITSTVERFREVAQRHARAGLPSFEIIHVTHDRARSLGGIDERGEEVGRTAVDLVAGMILRGEKGVPTVTKNMLVQGRWVEGAAPLRAVEQRPARGRRRLRRR